MTAAAGDRRGRSWSTRWSRHRPMRSPTPNVRPIACSTPREPATSSTTSPWSGGGAPARRPGGPAPPAPAPARGRGGRRGAPPMEDSRPWRVDPLPFVIERAEFDVLAEGATQRMRVLERFFADVYGPQRLIRDRAVPAESLY